MCNVKTRRTRHIHLTFVEASQHLPAGDFKATNREVEHGAQPSSDSSLLVHAAHVWPLNCWREFRNFCPEGVHVATRELTIASTTTATATRIARIDAKRGRQISPNASRHNLLAQWASQTQRNWQLQRGVGETQSAGHNEAPQTTTVTLARLTLHTSKHKV